MNTDFSRVDGYTHTPPTSPVKTHVDAVGLYATEPQNPTATQPKTHIPIENINAEMAKSNNPPAETRIDAVGFYATESQNPTTTHPKTHIPIEDINAEMTKLSNPPAETRESGGLLKAMPINAWIEQAKTRPIPKMLFGEFWYSGEICILYADTNLGKSILAVQIANSISKGESIAGFKLEAATQQVGYYDFELGVKQLEKRYSKDYQQHYIFSKSLIRIEIESDAEFSENNFEEELIKAIENQIKVTGAKVWIIDNITYLKDETEKAKNALPLMKHLKKLATQYELSLLVLAHTPKRDTSKPISKNDLQGSKMLMNFCDSAFAIGESYNDKNLRYLKQIKARSTEIIYDTENICVCQITKPHNFLQFEFLNYGTECEHLREISQKDRNELVSKVKELSQQGKSQRDIASELGIAVGTVNKYLKT